MGLSNMGRCLPLMVALSCSVFMVDRSQGATCSPGSQVAPNDNNQCIDIDECNSSPCHVNATCLNTYGSYDCTCNSGFQEPARHAGKRKGLMCEDVEECVSYPCERHMTCTNTVGSYLCNCNAGFHSTGTDCVDIDECKSSPCGDEETCTNTEGSYECKCSAGFQELSGNSGGKICEGEDFRACPIWPSFTRQADSDGASIIMRLQIFFLFCK
ncbi:latent-transforming growth factor beta-binding protein 4-like [Leucoraja erinacea]|uniref:latent-transforming growth factor beta-binding protein 4-like n=1 Tax=Leucoraja erinaceus TaxID=7782 RepID=UPI002453E22B|nr:latent-transforming growth factor beta-binding protein 4-like [Leucoraja erinacea]